MCTFKKKHRATLFLTYLCDGFRGGGSDDIHGGGGVVMRWASDICPNLSVDTKVTRFVPFLVVFHGVFECFRVDQRFVITLHHKHFRCSTASFNYLPPPPHHSIILPLLRSRFQLLSFHRIIIVRCSYYSARLSISSSAVCVTERNFPSSATSSTKRPKSEPARSHQQLWMLFQFTTHPGGVGSPFCRGLSKLISNLCTTEN